MRKWMRHWVDVLLPRHGGGNWGCQVRYKDHHCIEKADHGYSHQCACKFRWAE